MALTILKTPISPKTLARLGGVLYLVIIVLGGMDEAVIRMKLIIPGNIAATAYNIMASERLFRLSIAGDLLMQVCDIPSIVIFYLLLRPVSKSLALLAACFNLVQTAILGGIKVYLLATLTFLGRSGQLSTLGTEQRQAFASLALDMHENGYAIGLIFFSFTCLITGYLMIRSGYFPRAIGIAQIVAGVSYGINSFAQILSPTFAVSLLPIILLLAFLGELATCIWMLMVGVNMRKWKP